MIGSQLQPLEGSSRPHGAVKRCAGVDAPAEQGVGLRQVGPFAKRGPGQRSFAEVADVANRALGVLRIDVANC